MVALLLVQPALGPEFVRVGKDGRIPRCCKVAERDQRLRGDRSGIIQHPDTLRQRTGPRFPSHTHLFRDEVAPDLNVPLRDHSGVGGNNGVQSGKTGNRPFKKGKQNKK